MIRWRIRFVLSFAFAFLSAFPACAQSPTASAEPEVIERGKFILHKFEQSIGEETFDTTREAQSLVTKVSQDVSRQLGYEISEAAPASRRPIAVASVG